MRSVRALVFYLVFVFAGGALIAPWLYALVQMAAEGAPALQFIASKPFARFVNRALLVFALIGLIPFLRGAGLRSWEAVGLPKRPHALIHLGWGFGFGLLSLACVVILALAGGGRQLSPENGLAAVLGHFLTAALTAAVVAPMEEIVFRGALFGSLKRSMPWKAALLLSSAIYALLHFLERPGPVPRVGWDSGFVVLAGMMAGFTDLEKLIPGFLNLTVAGVILALAFQRSGSLYFSIGLHAGWIFWLKTYGFLTDAAAGSATWVFGSAKLINGWLAFVVLVAAFGLTHRFMPDASGRRNLECAP